MGASARPTRRGRGGQPSSQPVSPPTRQPTSAAPTPAPGSTVLSFNSALGVENVTVSEFLEDESAQEAAVQATADSMPGVLPEQVSIDNVTALPLQGAARRDRTRARSLTGSNLDETVTSNGILIDFLVETTTEQLVSYCSNCSSAGEAFTYLTSSLTTAVNDGQFTESLHTASVALNATATMKASAEANSTETFAYSSWTTTPSPSMSLTTMNVIGTASALARNEDAPLIGSLVGASIFLIAVVVFYLKPAWREKVKDTIRDSLSGGLEMRDSTWFPSKAAAGQGTLQECAVEQTVRNPMTIISVDPVSAVGATGDVESPMHREMNKNNAQCE